MADPGAGNGACGAEMVKYETVDDERLQVAYSGTGDLLLRVLEGGPGCGRATASRLIAAASGDGNGDGSVRVRQAQVLSYTTFTFNELLERKGDAFVRRFPAFLASAMPRLMRFSKSSTPRVVLGLSGVARRRRTA